MVVDEFLPHVGFALQLLQLFDLTVNQPLLGAVQGGPLDARTCLLGVTEVTIEGIQGCYFLQETEVLWWDQVCGSGVHEGGNNDHRKGDLEHTHVDNLSGVRVQVTDLELS